MPVPPRVVIMLPPHLYSSTHWDSDTPHHYDISKQKCEEQTEADVSAYCKETEASCRTSGACDQLRGCIIKCVIPPVLRKIAAERGLEVVSFELEDDGIAADGIHPTCGGHELIGKTVADKVFKESHIQQDFARKAKKLASERVRHDQRLTNEKGDGGVGEQAEPLWTHRNENVAHHLEKWMDDEHTCNKGLHSMSCPGPFCGTRGVLCP